MTTFVDRVLEVQALKEASRQTPGLVVMTGRRRVGKSAIVNRAFSGENVIRHQADEQPEGVQLASFARDSARLLGVPGLSFGSWDDALAFAGASAVARPGLVIVLDEFQYLCGSQPALPSIIQKHWDGWDRDRVAIVLVLVGSAISFMEKLLPAGSALHGRATLRPVIGPLSYRDAGQFAVPGASEVHRIERYAVLGGTPQYQIWVGADSVSAFVKRSVLSKLGPLYEEPQQLIRSEDGLRERGNYYAALAAIAAGRTRTGEIASVLEQPAGNASKILDRLRELRYVELSAPLSFSSKKSRAHWQISDPFFRFWFRWVFPNKSRLEENRVQEVWEDIAKDFDAFVGPSFEACCRTWVARYCTDEFARSAIQVGRWWSRDGQAEVDVVAVDKSRYTLLGACKWHRSLVGPGVLDQLYEHRAILGPKAAQAQLAIFARTGFKADLVSRAQKEEILLVTPPELFKPT